ncbi:MAG: tRNA (adenosine(37)-N6)-threonylcarbamoyltransferase complex dimerization subunit type 1 TsaB [Deltaproteobacteria bacterium HGW-Deltaproteobacteria-19]|jgi:tRNA threonylcarbamoyladenosine biosynthesis protein TsaB|nr:MAG: tRNA (adenosine(37)-N6)-threonylcarbamoyltransferase complex dimerization subunit type 1 TsaB [Deltaproteobacteria bacterium HGW-Deltaproteobacteria-19]
MKILALDTATKSASAALLEDERVLAEGYADLGRHHATVVLPFVQSILDLAGIPIEEIDLLAGTAGPGSFTGLRIGAGTLKGLALATGKPIVPVSTLETLAMNAAGGGIPVCPLLDARKGQVYGAIYRFGETGLPHAVIADATVLLADLLDKICEPVLFLGEGAVVHAEAIRERLGEKACFGPPLLNGIRASAAGWLAFHYYRAGRSADPLTFIPAYLRQSEAETKAPPPGHGAGECALPK